MPFRRRARQRVRSPVEIWGAADVFLNELRMLYSRQACGRPTIWARHRSARSTKYFAKNVVREHKGVGLPATSGGNPSQENSGAGEHALQSTIHVLRMPRSPKSLSHPFNALCARIERFCSKSVGEQEQLLKFQKLARHVVVEQATDTRIMQIDAPRPLLGRQQRPQWLRERRCSTPCSKGLLCKLVKSTSTTPKPRLYDDDG